jgi:hypothetical protein
MVMIGEKGRAQMKKSLGNSFDSVIVDATKIPLTFNAVRAVTLYCLFDSPGVLVGCSCTLETFESFKPLWTRIVCQRVIFPAALPSQHHMRCNCNYKLTIPIWFA